MNVRSILALLTGSVLAQLITFASSPYLSRIYPPDAFGVWAVHNSIVMILILLAAGRYELAIVLPADEQESKKILRQSFLINFCTLGVFLFFFLATASFWADFFKIPKQPILFVCIAISTFLFTGIQILSYWNTRQKNFSLISSSRIIQSVTMLGANIIFARSPLQPWGLVLGTTLGQLVCFSYLLFFIGAREALPSPLTFDRTLLGRYKEFPMYSMPGALLDTFSLGIPSMLASKYFGLEAAGFYAFANRMISTPLSMIHTAVSQVFFQSFAQAVTEDPSHAKAKKTLLHTWGMMAAVIITPLLVTWVWGPELFSWVFGSQWSEAGRIASLLAPMFFFFYISAPTSSSYLALKLQHFSLYFGLWSVLYRSFAFWWGYQKSNFTLALQTFAGFELFQLALHNGILWARLKKSTTLRETAPPSDRP